MLHNGHKEDNVWNLEDSLGAYFGARATSNNSSTRSRQLRS